VGDMRAETREEEEEGIVVVEGGSNGPEGY
jgi:hypothetical protein